MNTILDNFIEKAYYYFVLLGRRFDKLKDRLELYKINQDTKRSDFTKTASYMYWNKEVVDWILNENDSVKLYCTSILINKEYCPIDFPKLNKVDLYVAGFTDWQKFIVQGMFKREIIFILQRKANIDKDLGHKILITDYHYSKYETRKLWD